MTIEQLQATHQTRPFQPFDVHLADGRDFQVTHPEALAYSPKGRTIAIAISDKVIEVIDLLLVTSLTKGNGHSGPRTKRRT